MTPKRLLLSVWLALGIAALMHDALTGGGIAGYLLYREIAGFGVIEPTITYLGLAIPLLLVPGFLLLPSRHGGDGPATSRAARRVIMACCMTGAVGLAGIAALSVARALAVPGPNAPVTRVALDAPTPGVDPPAGARVVLRGTPRPREMVGYHEIVSGKFGPDIRRSHTIVPMTAADWTKDRPVRFLTDLRGAVALPGLPPMPWTRYQETAAGVLVPGPVPWYLARAFADQGIVLAPDARLHTTSAPGARDPWIGIAVAAGAGAAAILAGVVAAVTAPRHPPPERPTP